MWIPSKIVSYLEQIANATQANAASAQVAISALQTKLTVAETELQSLRTELHSAKINADWLRVKVNALEMERAGLLEKAYDIKLPVPEIVRTPSKGGPFENFSFDDVGDEMAKQLGL